ncbi:hypothetical protein ABIE63_002391 [Limibacillus sp. MBR-115]
MRGLKVKGQGWMAEDSGKRGAAKKKRRSASAVWVRRVALTLSIPVLLLTALLLLPIVPFTPYCDDIRYNRETGDYSYQRPVDWELSEDFLSALGEYLVDQDYYYIRLGNRFFVPFSLYIQLNDPPLIKFHLEDFYIEPITYFLNRNDEITSNVIFFLLKKKLDDSVYPQDMTPFGGPEKKIYYTECKFMPLVTKPGVFD